VYLFPIIYAPSQLFSKLVLAIFYLKISPHAWYNYTVKATSFCIFGAYTGILFASTFGCKPVAKSWNPFLDGTCIDVGALYKATALIGVILDMLLIVLPIPLVYNLKIPLRQKFGVLVVFSVGSV